MNSRDFVYWLQGYFELAGGSCNLNKEQVDVIKEHLKLVFVKETTEVVINSTHNSVISQEELSKLIEAAATKQLLNQQRVGGVLSC